jgi:hypothetical protein
MSVQYAVSSWSAAVLRRQVLVLDRRTFVAAIDGGVAQASGL